jgi:hypothetical protein
VGDPQSVADDRGGDRLEHGLVTGVRAVGAWPVGDDVGEPELGRAAGHLDVEVDRLEREAWRGVEGEHPVEGPPARGRHRVVEARDELADVPEPGVEGLALPP